MYLQFLQNGFQDLVDNTVPLNLLNRMVFMQDGTPPHFARIVRNYLDGEFNRKWMGRAGPIT